MSKIRLHGTSSGYTEIAPVAASGNNTLTLPNDGTIISKDAAGAVGVTSVHTTNITATGIATITTAKIGAGVTISESGIEASGIGITVANINGTQIGGKRNLIINGAMHIAQRGSSSTSTGYGSVDRFAISASGQDEAPTAAQVDVSSGTTPYTLGFRKSYKITNGNQTGGAGTSDGIFLNYSIEAQDVANSGWNYTSSSSFVTLSFWVKSSVAQNFYGRLYSYDGTPQGYVFETGSLTADTWTKIEKTIPGNSNLTFDNNNAAGLLLELVAFRGTGFTASMTLDQWAAYNSNSRVPDMTSTWYTTNDATLEFTGIQLEVGSQATTFEHRTFGDELQLCQRYCELIVRGASRYINNSVGYNTNALYIIIRFAVEKRSTPTFSHTSGTDYYKNWHNNTGTAFDGFSGTSWVNEQAMAIYTTSTVDAKEAGLLGANNASAEILMTSEL